MTSTCYFETVIDVRRNISIILSCRLGRGLEKRFFSKVNIGRVDMRRIMTGSLSDEMIRLNSARYNHDFGHGSGGKQITKTVCTITMVRVTWRQTGINRDALLLSLSHVFDESLETRGLHEFSSVTPIGSIGESRGNSRKSNETSSFYVGPVAR